MSVTYSNTPQNIDFCGNGLNFKVLGSHYVVTAGQVGVYVIQVPAGGVVADDYIELWDFENEERFRITFTTELASISEIAAVLFASYTFMKYYSLSTSGMQLTVSTREKITTLWTTMATLSANFSSPYKQNGVSPVYKSDYTLYTYLDYYSGSFNKKVTEFPTDPDNAGASVFSVGKLLKSYIKPSLPDLATAYFSAFYMLKYLMLVGERYKIDGTSISVGAMKSFTGWALNGKIDYEKFPGYSLVDDIQDNQIFLNTSGEIELWTDAMHFLHFFNPLATAETFYLKVKVYYTDLTNNENTIAGSAHTPDNGLITRFPCSLEMLAEWDATLVDADKTPYKYDVWIEHADESVLCSKTFRLIDKPMFYKEFAYLNKFGVIEFLNLATKATRKLVNKKNVSKYQPALDYAVEDPQLGVELDESYNQFEVTSGNITQEQALAFEYVLDSNIFYEIVNGDYIPCTIDEGTFEIIPESDDIVSVKFTYRRAFDR